MNNNTLEFFVKMKDMMSGGLIKLAATTKQTFTKMQQAVDTATNKIGQTAQKGFNTASTASNGYSKTLGSLYDKMNDLKRFRMDEALGSKEIKKATGDIKNYQREIDRLEGKRSGGTGGFLKHAALFAGLGLSAGSAFGFAKESVGAAMQFEAQKQTFGVLTGSKASGNALAGDLRELKENTVMGPAVYQNAQTMLAFGVSAKDVVPDLKMLGDVSLGDANRLQHLTLAFSEVQTQGRLTGKEVRQMSLQGFNPLNEIARTSGKSMEELRKEMKHGAITADMVTGAFKSATSEGGRFNGMLEQIGETSFGKMKILEGKWASLKIGVGQALMPFADETIKIGTNMIKWLGIAKTLPEAVSDEKNEIDALVSTITSLNQGNVVRTRLMETLKTKYPDVFSAIDIEKTKNGELLTVLDGINTSYEKRIQLAVSQKGVSDLKEQASQKFQDLVLFTTLNNKLPAGQKNDKGLAELTSEYTGLLSDLKRAKDVETTATAVDGISKLMQFSLDPQKMSTRFTGHQKDKDEFLKYVVNLRISGLASGYDMGTLKRATDLMNGGVNAADIKQGGIGKDGDGTGGKSSSDKLANTITGGGPRTININGVNMKLAENINVNSSDAKGILSELEPEMQKMFLRILNSGASIQ
jgi:tape measure domain-containing protein